MKETSNRQQFSQTSFQKQTDLKHERDREAKDTETVFYEVSNRH